MYAYNSTASLLNMLIICISPCTRKDAYKNQVTDPNNALRIQKHETYGRRIEKRDEAEASMSNLLKEFLSYEAEPVFSSDAELDLELQKHKSNGKQKYSTTNKVC